MPLFRINAPVASFVLNNFSNRHIGLYAYQRHALMEVSKLPPGPLEQIEMLEQLRWLEVESLDPYGLRSMRRNPESIQRRISERAIKFCREKGL
ncbi:MAG: hypothetical protein U0T81_03730 [Saprospiraceae bacterium]